MNNRVIMLLFGIVAIILLPFQNCGKGRINDVFLLSERKPPANNDWVELFQSKNGSSVNEAFYIELRQNYLNNQQYSEAMFINNEYNRYLAEAFNFVPDEYNINQILLQLPPQYKIDSLEYYVGQYYLARYGIKKSRLALFEQLNDSNCKAYSSNLYFLVKLYYGVELFDRNLVLEAWSQWQYCMNNIEYSDFSTEAYYVIGKALGETDNGTSLLLLKKALQEADNKAFEYECLNEIVQTLVHMAGDEEEIQNTDQQARYYTNMAHQIISDTANHVYEKWAASSVYRIGTESLLWLGKDSLANAYINNLLANKTHYFDSSLTTGYASILYGVKEYINQNYDSAIYFFKHSINIIGSGSSYLNTDLELPYAYIGSAYFDKGNYKQAIVYMQKSIKTLLSKHFISIDEPFRFIDPEIVSKTKYAYNVIMCLLRIEHYYKYAVVNSTDEILFNEAKQYAKYTNQLIKSWFLNAANEKTLTLSSKLLKQNHSVAIDILYQNGMFRTKQEIDSLFAHATEASSFYLNYLIQLKSHSNLSNDTLLNHINKLTLDINQNYQSKISNSLAINSLHLLKTKMLFNEQSKSNLQHFIYNINLPVIEDDSSAVIKYFVNGSTVYSIVYLKDTCSVFKTEFADFELRKKQFKRIIKSGSNDMQVQKLFYNKLILPVKHLLQSTNTLYLLNDEYLSEMPFELFVDSNGTLLIENYNIKYLYSTQNIDNLKQESPKANQFIGFAPGFINQPCVGKTRSRKLTSLKQSIVEVKQIDSLFRNEHLESRIYLNDSANRRVLFEAAKKADILHLATHAGKLNNNNGFYLSCSDTSQSFIPLSDIYKLQINADLVVLAACKAAIGELVRGEGVMALPRGFIYAGVPNVLATLWNVDDQKTSTFMQYFYKYIVEEKFTYSKALRQAKIDCMGKGFLPIDWAAFVLIGY